MNSFVLWLFLYCLNVLSTFIYRASSTPVQTKTVESNDLQRNTYVPNLRLVISTTYHVPQLHHSNAQQMEQQLRETTHVVYLHDPTNPVFSSQTFWPSSFHNGLHGDTMHEENGELAPPVGLHTLTPKIHSKGTAVAVAVATAQTNLNASMSQGSFLSRSKFALRGLFSSILQSIGARTFSTEKGQGNNSKSSPTVVASAFAHISHSNNGLSVEKQISR